MAPTHGKSSTYNNTGCRCDLCRAAHSERVGRQRADRLNRPEDIPHGTASGYFNWACKCELCRLAGSEENAKRYVK